MAARFLLRKLSTVCAIAVLGAATQSRGVASQRTASCDATGLRSLSVGFAIDKEFNAEFGGQAKAEAAIRSLVNEMNTAYEPQTGLHIHIGSITLLPASKPCGGSTSGNLAYLDTWTNRPMCTTPSGASVACPLWHLLSGCGGVQGDGQSGGFSWVNTIGGKYNTGVTNIDTDPNHTPNWWLVAHEIGHSLNADHDSSGNNIMSGVVSGPKFLPTAQEAICKAIKAVLANFPAYSPGGASPVVTSAPVVPTTAPVVPTTSPVVPTTAPVVPTTVPTTPSVVTKPPVLTTRPPNTRPRPRPTRPRWTWAHWSRFRNRRRFRRTLGPKL
jgi:hypothetical protein